MVSVMLPRLAGIRRTVRVAIRDHRRSAGGIVGRLRCGRRFLSWTGRGGIGRARFAVRPQVAGPFRPAGQPWLRRTGGQSGLSGAEPCRGPGTGPSPCGRAVSVRPRVPAQRAPVSSVPRGAGVVTGVPLGGRVAGDSGAYQAARSGPAPRHRSAPRHRGAPPRLARPRLGRSRLGRVHGSVVSRLGRHAARSFPARSFHGLVVPGWVRPRLGRSRLGRRWLVGSSVGLIPQVLVAPGVTPHVILPARTPSGLDWWDVDWPGVTWPGPNWPGPVTLCGPSSSGAAWAATSAVAGATSSGAAPSGVPSCRSPPSGLPASGLPSCWPPPSGPRSPRPAALRCVPG